MKYQDRGSPALIWAQREQAKREELQKQQEAAFWLSKLESET